MDACGAKAQRAHARIQVARLRGLHVRGHLALRLRLFAGHRIERGGDRAAARADDDFRAALQEIGLLRRDRCRRRCQRRTRDIDRVTDGGLNRRQRAEIGDAVHKGEVHAGTVLRTGDCGIQRVIAGQNRGQAVGALALAVGLRRRRELTSQLRGSRSRQSLGGLHEL